MAFAGAVTAASVQQALRRRPPTHPRWHRQNFRDRAVSLAGGPALALGAAATAYAAGATGPALAALAGGGLGLYDDLYGDEHARGLRGHVRALAEGRLTTGMVKLTGLIVVGAVVSRCDPAQRDPAQPVIDGSRIADAVLIAGTANLVNLLDLRPGRALKMVALAAAAATGMRAPAGTAAAGLAGAAAAVLPADLAEGVMIGDCGANAAGAALGACLAAGSNRAAKLTALGVVVGLTLASERVSFTEVIARTPWVQKLDEWGRRP